MARRSRQSFLKQQRERKRAEKAAAKRLKREQRRSGELGEAEDGTNPGIEEPAGVGQAAGGEAGETRPDGND